MPLVDILSEETEAQLRATLHQAQITIATIHDVAQQVQKFLARVERIADAIGVVK